MYSASQLSSQVAEQVGAMITSFLLRFMAQNAKVYREGLQKEPHGGYYNG